MKVLLFSKRYIFQSDIFIRIRFETSFEQRKHTNHIHISILCDIPGARR